MLAGCDVASQGWLGLQVFMHGIAFCQGDDSKVGSALVTRDILTMSRCSGIGTTKVGSGVRVQRMQRGVMKGEMNRGAV